VLKSQGGEPAGRSYEMSEQQITPGDIVPILWAAFGAAISVILGLVGVLYHKLTQTDKAQQDQLDEGEDKFEAHTIIFNQLKNDIVFSETRLASTIKTVDDKLQPLQSRIINDINGIGTKLKTETAAVERRLYELELLIAKVECMCNHHHELLLIIKDQHFRNHGEKIE
jgi:hypothetical protein